MRRSRSRKWRVLNRTVFFIIGATMMMTWGLFLGLRLHREASTDYDRVMASCITDRNQQAAPPVAKDAATIAVDCAHNTLHGQ